MSPESKKLFNIIILGVAFMFMFTAFQTCGNVAQTVIRSLNSTDFHGSGYTSMAIIYGVFSASNLITPSVVAIVGPQLSMFASGLFYSMYIAVFIQPFPWSFYTASVFIGIAAAVLWTAQGNCLTINSDEHTIGRNSGIFWALLQSSLFFGNLYIYFAWQGKTQISESDRRTVFIALTVISLVGTVLFFLIRKPDSENVLGEDESSDDQDMEVNESAQNNLTKAVDAFKKSFKLCVTKEMLLLSITTAYTGLELTFFSGVYGTCIGAINKFGAEEKSLIGLSGIFIGIGEILGGSLFGLLSKNNRFGRNPVVLLGILVHFIAFYLIFLNMPGDAPIAPVKGTDSSAYIKSRYSGCHFSSHLRTGGSEQNGIRRTWSRAVLEIMMPAGGGCRPALGVDQERTRGSICAAVAFFYSNYLLLHWQLLVMVIFGFFGTISFFTVEWEAAAFVARGSDYRSI
ncbi:PREDICTED: UNC93-like protein MFSD11 [Cercocebus atys]|uniref:UNC93-like protein MFSD11 n=1 Tax=Cercocebus atys TaxID=9531 RepID=UPI0005F52575|nr:PREDICTED: UNC93-like protein MFSD11 [Cercocebus atys]